MFDWRRCIYARIKLALRFCNVCKIDAFYQWFSGPTRQMRQLSLSVQLAVRTRPPFFRGWIYRYIQELTIYWVAGSILIVRFMISLKFIIFNCCLYGFPIQNNGGNHQNSILFQTRKTTISSTSLMCKRFQVYNCTWLG